MLLYLCEKCHKWQDVSIGVFLTNAWNNAMKSTPDAKIPDNMSYACPNGCGQMIQVKPEDKIALFKEQATQDNNGQLLEDVYALLKEYSTTFPWETELKDRADSLLSRIAIVPPEKEIHSFADAINKARRQRGYSVPLVTTNGRIIVRSQYDERSLYILFEDRECIGMYSHIDEIGLDLSKGWYPAGEEDTRWANAQSLILLECELEARWNSRHSQRCIRGDGKADKDRC